MKPKISVIIPVYNVERYLRECLDSVLCQTLTDFEVICVNDGSTDSSYEILKTYQEKDERIVLINQENQGQSVARNVGMESARGKYICFLDSDDMLVSDALEKLWKCAEVEQVDIVHYEVARLLYENEALKENGRMDEYCHVKNSYPGVRRGRELFAEMMENEDFVDAVWLLFIRTEWIRKHEIIFCSGAIYEDSIFSIECFFTCDKVIKLKDGFCIYRIRENSTMTEKYTFKHLYCRVWQLSECLKAIYMWARTEREVAALAKFAQNSIFNIQRIYYTLDESELCNREMNAFYKLLITMVIKNKKEDYNQSLKLIGLLQEIKNAENVILYGAGLVGKNFYNFLVKENLGGKIMGFATSTESAKNEIDKKTVRLLSEYIPTDTTLLVISASEMYHMEMSQMAKRHGFKKIYFIEYDMECAIEKSLLEL